MLLLFPADGRWTKMLFFLEATRSLLVVGRGSTSCWCPRGIVSSLHTMNLCIESSMSKESLGTVVVALVELTPYRISTVESVYGE